MDTLVEVYILAYPPFTVIVANAALAWDPQNRRKMEKINLQEQLYL